MLKNNMSAISWLDRPSATSCNISRSRSVRSFWISASNAESGLFCNLLSIIFDMSGLKYDLQ
jgi:hypothetical protein